MPSACGGGGTCGMCKCQSDRGWGSNTAHRDRLLHPPRTA
ncbi:MAG: 2Fe-2S iron-sulfur cluster-binding protein [Marinilabiliales bacterium]|nr:2Fe-2S iron-sulfur cluster-binding protein [Marinilabiliales bacterium]